MLYITLFHISPAQTALKTMCKGTHCTCWQTYPERSWIQFLILRILYEKPTYGFQLLEEIEERSCGCHKLEPGSIYTVLRRMEQKELLTSSWEKGESGPQRRVYTVNEKGVDVLKIGLSTIVRRKQLFDDLIGFYERQFQPEHKGGEE